MSWGVAWRMSSQFFGSRDERHCMSSPRLTANAGAQVGTVMPTTSYGLIDSGRGSANVGSEPKWSGRLNTGDWPASTYLSGCFFCPLGATHGRRTVSMICGGPPNSLLKNWIWDVFGFPSLTVKATTLP